MEKTTGLVSDVVNQNHDGISQKAGVPEAKINEIHGAWFDPSNAVVQFNQNLRHDLFERLLETEKRAEMVLCVGTSLSGMNADRVVHSCAKRFVKRGQGRGSVVVNLQKTPSVDEALSLRIWATADTVFEKLASKLQLSTEAIEEPPAIFRTLVPYEADGERMADDGKRLMVLDVRPGASVVVGSADDPNPNNYRQGMVLDQLIQGRHPLLQLAGKPGKLSRQAALGNWWIWDAKRGAVRKLCVRNVPAQFVNVDETLCTVVQHATPMAEENGNSNNKYWNWSIEVIGRDDDLLSISQVDFELHPTFNPSKVRVSEGPFKISRSGWGEFTVKLKITFADESQVQTTVDLDFAGQGKKSFQVPIKARKI